MIETLKANSIIKIEISTDFYALLTKTFHSLLTQKPENEAMEILKKLATGEAPVDDYESSLCVMIALIKNIEDRAEEQGLTIGLPELIN